MSIITNFGVPVSGSTTGTLMPKLQYRFRVSFIGLGNLTKADEVTKNVISISRPALTHEEVIIDVYNSKIRSAGKHTWTDITCVLRDDLDSNVIKALGSQMSAQVDHGAQSSAAAGHSYKFKMIIETLDGGSGTAAKVLDRWELNGCWIPDIQYGDLNYGTSDAVQCTMTIRYDVAQHDAGGDVLLGGFIGTTTGAGKNHGAL